MTYLDYGFGMVGTCFIYKLVNNCDEESTLHSVELLANIIHPTLFPCHIYICIYKYTYI